MDYTYQYLGESEIYTYDMLPESEKYYLYKDDLFFKADNHFYNLSDFISPDMFAEKPWYHCILPENNKSAIVIYFIKKDRSMEKFMLKAYRRFS